MWNGCLLGSCGYVTVLGAQVGEDRRRIVGLVCESQIDGRVGFCRDVSREDIRMILKGWESFKLEACSVMVKCMMNYGEKTRS